MDSIPKDQLARLVELARLRIDLDLKKASGVQSPVNLKMEHMFDQKMSDLVELGYGAQIVKSSIAEVILVIQSTPGQSEPNPNREELQAAKQKVQMLEIDVKRLEDVARKAEDDLAAIDIFAPVDILSFENNDSVIDLAGIVKRALATGDSEKIKGTDVEARTMWLAAREQVHELFCTKISEV
jgi:hypothetical protein